MEDSYVFTKKAADVPEIKFNVHFNEDDTRKPKEIYRNDNAKLVTGGIDVDGVKSLEVGDKISNLHGQKGTITNIIPDRRFKVEPCVFESDTLETIETKMKTIDVLMNYDSIISRGAFGIFCELGYATAKRAPNVTSEFLPVESGYLIDSETDTKHAALFGKLHFMVLDKMSRFIMNRFATIDYMTRYAMYANTGSDCLWTDLPYQI